MREVIIVKMPEDTPLTPIRKSPAFKLKMRQEHQFLNRQERYFFQVVNNMEVTDEEFWLRCARGRKW
jgi:hypothetical protein